MAKFVVDVNLPYYFSLWKSEEYIHQIDQGDDWTDEQIWEFCASNNMTIITKDADFSNKILLKQPPPKVIHIRFGNMKMKDFHETITSVWHEVLELNKDYKLVNVYKDRIEAFQ